MDQTSLKLLAGAVLRSLAGPEMPMIIRIVYVAGDGEQSMLFVQPVVSRRHRFRQSCLASRSGGFGGGSPRNRSAAKTRGAGERSAEMMSG